VLFPAFSVVERDDLGRVYLVALRGTVIVTIPVAIFMVILAEPLLVLAFGEKWRPAADAMRVLAAYAAVSTISIPSGTAFKAINRPGVLLAISVPRAILLAVSLALFADEGLVAVALCQLTGSAAMAVGSTLLAGPMLGARLRGVGAALGPAAVAGAALAAATAGTDRVVAGDLPSVLAGGLAGSAAYLAVLGIVAPATVRDIAEKLRGRGPPPPSAAPPPPGPERMPPRIR
jgi:PST family polysaccharide transporter